MDRDSQTFCLKILLSKKLRISKSPLRFCRVYLQFLNVLKLEELGYSSMVECLPSTSKALGVIPSFTEKEGEGKAQDTHTIHQPSEQ